MQPTRTQTDATDGPRRALRRGALAPVLLLTLLAGCQVGPDYAAPELQLPSGFRAELERGLVTGDADLARWWAQLGDPVLDGLMQRVEEGNLDLAAARTRVREARALRGITETDLLPSIDVRGAAVREQSSSEGAQGDLPGPKRNDRYSTGLDAAWEIDLWGRVARSVEVADAEVEVSLEDARGALVSVLAETALAYVDLRSGQERLRIARSNVELRTRTRELTESQFAADLVSRLDVLQARADLERTRSRVPPLETVVRAAKNRLAVLLGRTPGSLEDELAAVAPVPVPPPSVAVGVPADILRRRPDVRRAERALAAQSARIGVATAELYPRLSLLGDLGVSAIRGSKLTGHDAVTYGIGPSFRWNVFDRDRIRGGIEVEDARYGRALLDYERTVLLALEEIENALTGFVRDQRSRDALLAAVEASAGAVDVSQERYRQGLTDFQTVLDSQRRLFELEDSLALTDASITRAVIRLYRALGGGWERMEPLASAERSQDAEASAGPSSAPKPEAPAR